MTEVTKESVVLPAKFGGGPHGIGDPNDQTLRRVEMEVLIPQIMRDEAKLKCSEQVKAFTGCCKENGLLMVIKCQDANESMKNCLTQWYQNEEFKESCKKQYLDRRTEFRLTGVKKKYLH